MANVFYDTVLKNLEKTLSANTNIRTNIGTWSGTESMRLIPVSAEIEEKTNASVTYLYTTLIQYKNKELDIRRLTQKAHDIRSVLDDTLRNIPSTTFYDGTVIEIDLAPEPEVIEDTEELEEQVDINILFTCLSYELL